MVSDASPVLNKAARRSRKYGKIAKLKNLLQNAYRAEMHDTHFFKNQLFCLRISLVYSFFYFIFLLFHSYKKFLVFTGCILYIVSNFVQMGNL